jgi:hypothetical protein
MSHFVVKVLYKHGNPAEDIMVLIDYGLSGGCETKNTTSDGFVVFQNRENKSGKIYVDSQCMGCHSLKEGKIYSFTI